jgi:hypothetical protein
MPGSRRSWDGPSDRRKYDRVLSYLELSGIERGYVQELDAAGENYIPEFE